MTSVIVVGAGVVGLFCALRLAKSGASVVVLEAEPDAFSVYSPTTSLTAAGMLSPLVEEAPDAPCEELALEAFDLWKRLAPGALWEDGVRFDGAAIVSLVPDVLLAGVRARGRKAAPLSAGEWRKRTGFMARTDKAVFVEDEGVADPIRVLSGLAMEVRRYGVRTLFNCDVADVDAHSATTHEGERFEADAILLAPGVWASDKLIAAAPALSRLRPAKGHLVAVTLERPLKPNVHAPGFYLARRMENDVVLGATMEFGSYDRGVSQVRVQELLAAAEALFPGEVRMGDAAWAGVRPMSPDGAPMIGKSGDVWVAAGHSRNGWLYAPLTAEIITAEIMGEEFSPLWSRFNLARLAP